jgi:hypothetical protein
VALLSRPDKLTLSNERAAAAPCITFLQRSGCDQGGTNTSRPRLFGMEESTALGPRGDRDADWAQEYGRGLRLLYHAHEGFPSDMQALVDKFAELEDQ